VRHEAHVVDYPSALIGRWGAGLAAIRS
jgi:hypothetical protein